jgi:hypothetical protein
MNCNPERAEYVKLIGVSVRTANYDLEVMEELGFIERTGVGRAIKSPQSTQRSQSSTIPATAYEPAPPTRRRTRMTQIGRIFTDPHLCNPFPLKNHLR